MSSNLKVKGCLVWQPIKANRAVITYWTTAYGAHHPSNTDPGLCHRNDGALNRAAAWLFWDWTLWLAAVLVTGLFTQFHIQTSLMGLTLDGSNYNHGLAITVGLFSVTPIISLLNGVCVLLRLFLCRHMTMSFRIWVSTLCPHMRINEQTCLPCS